VPAGRQVHKVLEIIAKAAESKQAIDLKILDLSKTSNIVDYLVVCSGESEPQIQAIKKEVDSELRKNKIKGYKWEGVIGSGWVVLDLGWIVVHVMGMAERERYQLEYLWGKDAIVYHY